MNDETLEFNLLHEPWIVVLNKNGTTEEVGLIELFERAHEFQDLAGELPTQDIAILRLLLAIMHAVFEKFDPEGDFSPLYDDGSGEARPEDALSRWQKIWQTGHLNIPILRQYLINFEDRFWLFHPERPFYQVPQLSMYTDYSAAKLNAEISQSGNKHRFFSSRSGKPKNELTFAEAARWLIHLQGFDDASNKPLLPKKEKEMGVKLPKTGISWLGRLGLIMTVGENLFETLMLNFILLRDGQSLWEVGEPIWELDEVRTAQRTEIPQPRNLADLYTLQSRRVILTRQDDKVTGYRLVGGDVFQEVNAFVEPMTVWHKTSKKNSPDEYSPKSHDPARQMWRDFASMFVSQSGHRVPGIVQWVSLLVYRKMISRPLIGFRIAAVKYDSNNCSITEIFTDSVSFHKDLLVDRDMDQGWIDRILEEIEMTERLVQQIDQLAKTIAITSGSTLKDSSKLAAATREQAYFRLDLPFRQWLGQIDPQQDDPVDVSNRWWKTASQIVGELGLELVGQCSHSAYAERVIHDKKKELRYSLLESYNYFRFKISSRDALKGGEKGGKIQRRSG